MELEQGDGAGPGKELVMVCFGNSGKQEREGKAGCVSFISVSMPMHRVAGSHGKPALVSGDSTVKWNVSASIPMCQITVNGQRVLGVLVF